MVAALQTVFDGASGSDKVDRKLWRSWRVRSVTRTGSTISVDLSGGPKGGSPGADSHLALLAAEHTYGFTLELPQGRYNLTVETISEKDQRMQTIGAFTVR